MHERDRDLMQNNKVTLVPAGKFEQPGMIEALRCKDGSILMNTAYKHFGVNGPTMALYQRFLDAEVVVLHGKWVFIPDEEEKEDESTN